MTHTIVTIEKLLNNTMGMSRTEAGEVVFVPDALPGERHELLETSRKKSVLTAVKSKRLSDAPFRVEPSCPHAQHCGGCQLLHIHADHETEQKAAYLRDTLARIAKWQDAPVTPAAFSARQSRIRGKFHLTSKGEPGFKQASGNRVTPIQHCHVIPHSLRDAMDAITEWVAEAGFKGEIHFGADAQRNNPVLEFKGQYKKLLKRPIPGIKGYRISTRKHPVSVGDPFVKFDWNGVQVSLTPSQFFQSNPDSWPLFFKWVKRFQTAFQPKTVWDVHAGSGFLSSALDPVKVLCSEPDNRTWSALKEQVATPNRPVRLFKGTAESALAQSNFKDLADAAILDPPREGLNKPLRDWLVSSGPSGLLYFSCDMGSFSRDLRELLEAYKPASEVAAMNLNPGTPRLETAILLERLDH